MPLPIAFRKIMADYVTSDTREGNVALSPLLETKVESVVLDPRYASNTILLLISFFVSIHPSFTRKVINAQ